MSYTIPHNIPYFDDVTLENNYSSDDDHVHEDVEVDFVAAHVEDVNKNSKKSHKIVTIKKDQLIAQGYTKDSTLIAHLEAIRMLLGLPFILMFTLY